MPGPLAQPLYTKGTIVMKKSPKCPDCDKSISFFNTIFTFNSSWNYRCPHCKSKVEFVSLLWKFSSLLGFISGFGFAIVSIYLRKQNVWSTAESYFFFSCFLLIMFVIEHIAWQKVKFKSEKGV